MTVFYESSPQAFPILCLRLFSESGKLLIEAPGAKEAAVVYRALQNFRVNSAIFSPSFLLMERGDIEVNAQQRLFEIITNPPDILVTTPLSRRWRLTEAINSDVITVKPGSIFRLSTLAASLSAMGYLRVPIVQDFGEFSLKGDILDIAPADGDNGIRIEFFDETVELIRQFSLSSQKSGSVLQESKIIPLLSGRNLAHDWHNRLRKLMPDKGTRELIELEEAIESGAGSAYDIYPLICAGITVGDLFKGKVVRWEKIRAGLTLTEDIEKLSAERRRRQACGSFAPFAVEPYFIIEMAEPDIEISSFFSSGESIRKFASSNIRPSRHEKDNPDLLLKNYLEENAVILLAGEKDGQRYADFAVEKNIEALPVDTAPLKYDKIMYIIPGEPWFEPDSFLHMHNIGLTVIPTALFSDKPHPHKKVPVIAVSDDEPIVHPPLSLEKLGIGEYIVHYKYGIAIYEGIKRVADTDCLILSYESTDRIYVPVYNMHFIYKYRWEEGCFPKVSSLRSTVWETTRAKMTREIEQVAEKILQLYAERSVETGFRFGVRSEMVDNFYESFPYKETPDQLRSVNELETDMNSEKIMDRLLCGDVGFGKTEIAMRGCMIAIASGKQAAVLVPTTVLAFQHFQVFGERFREFPVKVEMLSRFYSAAKQKQVIADIRAGKVDIVIGTHRLLSKDIEFRELGFLVVDEEHRFGVTQKERIKEIKKGVATLAMTATPIPRTLQMSLLGVRDMSFIKTAPRERKNVRTHILEFSEEIIREAILRELERKGQVYFVHNRIDSLPDMRGLLLSLIPELRIATAHGKMEEEELEQVMIDFTGRKFDVLLATSLIESGIDIPMVNTIIINRADAFGLAQLYQLRGRVGRWNREAYAYLMVPSMKTLSKDSYNRLAVIKRFDKLGSGYQVAMEDLNIRGGGNILGMSQSGKLKGVGYDLYLEMLRRRIEFLKTGKTGESGDIEIKTHVKAFIPEDYIEDAEVRVSFYRKLAGLERPEELIWLSGLFTEMYGAIPEEVENLLELTGLKIAAKKARISAIEISENEMTVKLAPEASPKSIELLFQTIEKLGGKLVPPDGVRIPATDMPKRLEAIHKLAEVF